MKHNLSARVAILAGVGVIASSLAFALPASADSGNTTLNAGNGTVNVNQVLAATYVAYDASTSCDDEPGAVTFGFKISNGTVVFLSIRVGRPSGHIRVGVQGIDRNGLVVPRQCLLKS